eukprot:comp21173_c0_seq1/m.28702 comp21173_c0_seq1/g.28702  ORF comp21173_c0_seq1/g.28702 comp21173_c0_seq1/m.28702 type:complete len:493 (-) comp21173_c0_seq1:526-2004(-)
MAKSGAQKAQDALKAQLDVEANKEDNRICADCEAKTPRWASYNLGIFICMNCAGHHRNLGTHVSKIKSLTLDSWTQEQVDVMKQFGNRVVNDKYEAALPRDYIKKDQADFIRRKYDRKEWFRQEGGGAAHPRRKSRSHATAPAAVAATAQSQAMYSGPEEKYSHQLAQLQSMGFTNNKYNVMALQKANGDVNMALEELIANPPPEERPSQAARRTVVTSVDHEQARLQSQLDQLRSMGFSDEVKNRMAIRQSGGDMQGAIDFLVKLGAGGGVAAAAQPKQQAPQQNVADLWGSAPAPQPQAQAAPAVTIGGGLEDIFGGPVQPAETHQPAAAAAQPPAAAAGGTSPGLNKMNKTDILSLYNTAPAMPQQQMGSMANPYMQQAAGFGGMPGFGMPNMGFPAAGAYGGYNSQGAGFQQPFQQQYQQPTQGYQQQPYGQPQYSTQSAFGVSSPFGAPGMMPQDQQQQQQGGPNPFFGGAQSGQQASGPGSNPFAF